MIIFFQNGQLGNQLFQYYGIKKFFPNHRIIFVGFKELRNYFSGMDEVFIFQNEVSFKFVIPILRRLFILFAYFRIFSYLTETNKKLDFSLKIKKGLFHEIILPYLVYFQHSAVFREINTTLNLKFLYKNSAYYWLKLNKIDDCLDNIFFVHVRRKDYLKWPSSEFPAFLEIDWYLSTMDKIRDCHSDAIFIILGDDSAYNIKVFSGLKNVYISNNNLGVDFALMSLCKGGVLSASSFAWWGAIHCGENKLFENLFYAPKYWIGHRLKVWNPPGFRFDWINYY